MIHKYYINSSTHTYLTYLFVAVLLSIEIFSTVFFQTARSSIVNRRSPISTSVSLSSKYVRGLLRRQTCGRRPCLEKSLLCIQHVQLELLLCRQKGYQIKVFLPKGAENMTVEMAWDSTLSQ